MSKSDSDLVHAAATVFLLGGLSAVVGVLLLAGIGWAMVCAGALFMVIGVGGVYHDNARKRSEAVDTAVRRIEELHEELRQGRHDRERAPRV